MAIKEGAWLTIMEYSRLKGVSISTIRRHIKANLVKFREEDGKYFIYTHSAPTQAANDQEAEIFALKLEQDRLKRQIQSLFEELAEAKMLIELYEKSNQAPVGKELPPEVPWT